VRLWGLMYKTAVYTLVDGCITHQKQQIPVADKETLHARSILRFLQFYAFVTIIHSNMLVGCKDIIILTFILNGLKYCLTTLPFVFFILSPYLRSASCGSPKFEQLCFKIRWRATSAAEPKQKHKQIKHKKTRPYISRVLPDTPLRPTCTNLGACVCS